MTEPDTIDPDNAPRLAFHRTDGAGPTVIFLPGYASDMEGTKATALEDWAREQGRGYIRFDYSGCGKSEGAFEDRSLADWLADVLSVIDELAEGPVVLVGSSMGGWLMLLAARQRPDRVVGLVGIAPAPDFTDWGFTPDQKMTILTEGRLEEPSAYDDSVMVTTRKFWSSGEANRMTFGRIAISCPVRLLQGQRDKEVPWERTARLTDLLDSQDVQLWLVKDGDHRLSRERDIALLFRAVADVCAAVA
ncbi:alpha/beta hydrolase [Stakelama sp. CBK3Z-3]|uniref:palmitoyl-protein hydrolase n=1 Tax=Stakelama flava TaxID=2860338 RepID=A0ABS6XPC3_9SPHN|nr:alpha/beta hydrolase [Stakelama flava]MBW4331729.1 alpha/beta hydrolase [Stakelama flava]